MTQTHAATPTLAALVDDLVIYLRDRQKLKDATHQSPPPPEGLQRVFTTFSHHMVALTLVARSDSDVAAKERDVVLRHCKALALAAGLEMTAEEEQTLGEYLRRFRPTMQQLTAMLDRLEHDTKAEIAGLIGAAHSVVEADGVVRFQEVAYLASLQHDLLAL